MLGIIYLFSLLTDVDDCYRILDIVLSAVRNQDLVFYFGKQKFITMFGMDRLENHQVISFLFIHLL